jgi:APA family basic amino acid/polyamine antiporter
MEVAPVGEVRTDTRPFGLWMAVALVMGNMIGSGVFLLPASLAPFGALSLGGWLVSTAGSLLLALVFARLAANRAAAGGPYAYTRAAFGELAGFVVAWGYWISVWSANAALAVAMVGYLGPFIPSIVRNDVYSAGLAIATVWILTGINMRGVGIAGVVQLTTTALKILPLVFVGVGGLFFVNGAHFAVTDASPHTIAHGITATATLTLWAFLGLECATIPAGTIRDAERTIPRATIVGTLLTGVIYILSTIAVMGLVPPAVLAQTTAPYADAARVLAGGAGAAIVSIGAAISCFGALNGWILIVGQLPLAVAEDGLFPSIFRRTSAAGTPHVGLLIGAIMSTALIATNYTRGLVSLFTFVILLSTLSTLVPYAFCSLAVFLIGRPSATRGTSGWQTIAALAFAYSLWAIGGAGTEVVYWGFLLLMSGLPVYVWVIRK